MSTVSITSDLRLNTRRLEQTAEPGESGRRGQVRRGSAATSFFLPLPPQDPARIERRGLYKFARRSSLDWAPILNVFTQTQVFCECATSFRAGIKKRNTNGEGSCKRRPTVPRNQKINGVRRSIVRLLPLIPRSRVQTRQFRPRSARESTRSFEALSTQTGRPKYARNSWQQTPHASDDKRL